MPKDALDRAWRSTDVIERFAAQLSAHLEPAGHALLVLSSDGERSEFLGALERSGFAHEIVAERDFVNEVMRVYLVRRC
jgi:hypothetical protein